MAAFTEASCSCIRETVHQWCHMLSEHRRHSRVLKIINAACLFWFFIRADTNKPRPLRDWDVDAALFVIAEISPTFASTCISFEVEFNFRTGNPRQWASVWFAPWCLQRLHSEIVSIHFLIILCDNNAKRFVQSDPPTWQKRRSRRAGSKSKPLKSKYRPTPTKGPPMVLRLQPSMLHVLWSTNRST